MKMFLITLIECSAAMSIISLIYMTGIPLLSKRYSAKWLYYTWVVVVMGWIFPFRPHLDTNIFPLQIPQIQVTQSQYICMDNSLKIVCDGTGSASAIPLWWVIASIWVTGMLGMIAYNAWKHRHFLKMVNRWSEDITNHGTIDILEALKAEMKIKTHVGLKICPVITSPMMVGFFRPSILLPTIKIDSDELTFILRHELVHLKRNDLWCKALVLLVTAIHWFNPVVHIIAKAIAVQCEISCDELLVQGSSMEQRKQYGETLIGLVRTGVKLQTAFSTNFYKEGNFIKTRIFQIMDSTKKKTGIAALCVILIAIMGSGVTLASDFAKVGLTATQLKQGIIDPSKGKQVINVDVKNLENGKFVCLGGSYTLEEGDIIQCNINSEGNNGLMIKLLKEDIKTSDGKRHIQELTRMDSQIQNPGHQVRVNQSQCGNCYLFILNEKEGVPSNIKGTIEIIKGK